MTSISIYSESIPATQSKICSICKELKLLEQFTKKKDSKDGLRTQCKSCNKEYTKANKERHKKSSKERDRTRSEEYIRLSKESDREYYKANKEYYKEYRKRYAQDNKGIINAKTAKRRATKLNATPKWAEFDLIKQLYIDCRILSESTGIEHHVDHIVPLQSDFVCGLHCIANLRIITASENHSKYNSYWPDMF